MECYNCDTANIIENQSWCADKDQLDAHAPSSKLSCPGIAYRWQYTYISKQRKLPFFLNITLTEFCTVRLSQLSMVESMALNLILVPFKFQRQTPLKLLQDLVDFFQIRKRNAKLLKKMTIKLQYVTVIPTYAIQPEPPDWIWCLLRFYSF